MASFIGLAGASVLPAEHAHYAPDGHHAAVVHRHFSEAPSSKASAIGDHDDHVLNLREPWLAGRTFALLVAVVDFAAWCETPPLPRAGFVASAVLRIDHGPPIGPHVVRGPPFPA